MRSIKAKCLCKAFLALDRCSSHDLILLSEDHANELEVDMPAWTLGLLQWKQCFPPIRTVDIDC